MSSSEETARDVDGLPRDETLGERKERLLLTEGLACANVSHTMTHRFTFFRAGGVDQVQLRTGADLVALEDLDQKLWVALSCPVLGLEFDQRTLTLIDTNGDERVRAPELLAAIRWTKGVLADVESLARPDEPLTASLVRGDSDEGKQLRGTIESLLRGLGKGDKGGLSVEDTARALEVFNGLPENGDGVLPPEAVEDESLRASVRALLSGISAPSLDRSGVPGITLENLSAFSESAEASRAWQERGKAPELLPLGPSTAEAFAAFAAVEAKIQDYFTRVRIAAFDGRALPLMNGPEAAYESLSASLLDSTTHDLERLPLARVTSSATLPLGQEANPAWAERLAAFREKVVLPLLGDFHQLAEQDFRGISAKFAGHAAHLRDKPSSPWGGLKDAAREALSAAETRQKLEALLKADLDAAPRAAALEAVEKLVRFKRDLLKLANNFVSFRDFYRPGGRAIFQIGTLYLDQREFDLVLRVNDATKHVALGALASTYLLYLDAKSAKGDTQSIVAAVTNGDTDNLMVGRNGVFYDRSGADWDATVTRIVENPISLRQAVWSPYKKLVRILEEQVSKRAAAAQSETDAKLDTKADTLVAATEGDVRAAPPKKLDIGVVAALGVAVGGITAALGVLLQAFLGLGLWMPLGVLGILCAISGPSVAVAGLKLRRRNLGPLLDANGWAINVMPRINLALGHSLTQVAALPRKAARDLVDPFADRRPPVWRTAFAALALGLLVAWFLGWGDRFLPTKYRSTSLLGEAAPAAVKAKPASPPSE